ncbi:MAG: type II toxin-antitoxin system VapC family toxin [Paracoccus sp. (in: a-proteobacteria)]
MLIIDASALIGWLMPDESGPDLASAMAGQDDVLAPWLLWVELRNILLVSERRGRLPAGMTEQIVEAIDDLGIRLDVTPSGPVVLDLCRRHGLTAYAALYLEAALRHGGELASLDKALLRAAVAEGVAVLDGHGPG